ncbi:polyprenyl synthetase family protein [Desulfoscipio geothermicus]|uniref:Polyprenyl synthetase n=1 Tax=Desulfoscipio geothermicus DSM 3669 TaxID=1121426 RepID=A0A1I6DX00_9FIRM|nr:polyprenyl synthetase family protein [Desulfoscipio geothermicus]SFR10034.1 Polyprenyl synthetase [Desulfoscipio geothermicus DSM 3669]
MHLFHHICEDLKKVQLLIQKNFNVRAGNVNDFIKQDYNYLDINLRPALVIISNRLFGPVTPQTIALGAVLQFIYMASQVHIRLSESGPGKDKSADIRSAYQFPVLVGDFLYGKFFTTLCEAGIVRYLSNLAELICAINKCGILNINNPGLEFADKRQYIDIVRGESAEIFACCARLGADLGGADSASRQRMYDYGINLGMAYALLERGASLNQINKYLTTAESIIKQFPPSDEQASLKNLLDLLAKENIVVQRMVG